MWANNNPTCYCKMFFYKNIFLSLFVNTVQEVILTIFRNKMESQKK